MVAGAERGFDHAKTTAYEPKYSDDTTWGVQVNLAAKDDCINEGIMLARARVP